MDTKVCLKVPVASLAAAAVFRPARNTAALRYGGGSIRAKGR